MTSQVRRRTRGISTIVGAAIAISITFTVLVPLFVFMQNTNALYTNEANNRRLRDIERAAEELLVTWTSNPERTVLGILVHNQAYLHSKVVRLWAVDVQSQSPIGGDVCLTGMTVWIPPGENRTFDVTNCVAGFTGSAVFLAVTERGRIFSSDIIQLESGLPLQGKFPYTIVISIINMRRGVNYDVTVTPVSPYADAQPRLFRHKATASNENVTMAFGALAGVYEVALFGNGRLVSQPTLVAPNQNPIDVTAGVDSAVIFELQHVNIRTVELDVQIAAPGSVKDGSAVTVTVTAKLPNNADEDVVVSDINVALSGGITNAYCITLTGTPLAPGETEIVAICSGQARRPPSKIDITASVAATGVSTGLGYTGGDTDSINVTP